MSEEKVCWALIEVVHKTNANFVIVPLQDILCLDNQARMNYRERLVVIRCGDTRKEILRKE